MRQVGGRRQGRYWLGWQDSRFVAWMSKRRPGFDVKVYIVPFEKKAFSFFLFFTPF